VDASPRRASRCLTWRCCWCSSAACCAWCCCLKNMERASDRMDASDHRGLDANDVEVPPVCMLPAGVAGGSNMTPGAVVPTRARKDGCRGVVLPTTPLLSVL